MDVPRHPSLLAPVLLVLGMAALVAKPAVWLGRGWLDPALGPAGLWVALAAAALFVWSATSRGVGPRAAEERRAWVLLGLTAAMRLCGQVLAFNVVGALALVVDVYALALLAGCARRERALSPGWLAALFALSLPVERLAQRSVGYALQRLAAGGAAAALGLVASGVEREGTRLFLDGREVLVDLPCSGARGLVHGLIVLAALAALGRPCLLRGLLGIGVALGAATAANSARIAVLALGAVRPAALAGIDVTAPFWHQAIGLATLALGLAPIVVWSRGTRPPPLAAPRLLTEPEPAPAPPRLTVAIALAYAVTAAAIVTLPARPLDVSRALGPIALPASLAGAVAQPVALSAQETFYFTRFGGAAAKALYGSHALLVVRSTAPLRHLHGPDECLVGAGHHVARLGVVSYPYPTAVYRSTAPDGRVWRVAVSFISADGAIATSIAETVWKWIQKPGVAWSVVERISPWDADPQDVADFDLAVAQALDLPIAQASAVSRTQGGGA